MDLGLDIPSVDLRWGFRLLEYRHCKDLYKQERKERDLGGKKERTLLLLWARDHLKMESMRAAMNYLQTNSIMKIAGEERN